MFGRKNKKAIEVTKLSSLIADNLQIVGDVLFSGGLRIDGKVEGNVLGKKGEKSLIVLSDKGCVVGRIHAYDAVVNGSVSGDLEVDHFLELQAGAKVSGNITYRQLQMECGASVEGKLVCAADEEAPDHVGGGANKPGPEAHGGRAGRALDAPAQGPAVAPAPLATRPAPGGSQISGASAETPAAPRSTLMR